MEQGAAPGAGEIKSVFVGKLPESATEEKLQALFSGFGEIEKVTEFYKLIVFLLSNLQQQRAMMELGSVRMDHSRDTSWCTA